MALHLGLPAGFDGGGAGPRADGGGADGGLMGEFDGNFAGFDGSFGGGPGLPRTADGGSFFETDGGTACTNCHGPTATNGPYKDVSHTPEQTGGFSDTDLQNIIWNGEVPDGGYFDPTVLMHELRRRADMHGRRRYAQWHSFHRWTDITSDELPGVICYLRVARAGGAERHVELRRRHRSSRRRRQALVPRTDAASTEPSSRRMKRTCACWQLVTRAQRSRGRDRRVERRSASTVDAAPPVVDATASDADDAGADPCEDAGVPAATLACTGLYANFATKEVAAERVRVHAVHTALVGRRAEAALDRAAAGHARSTSAIPTSGCSRSGRSSSRSFASRASASRRACSRRSRATFWVYATYAWNSDDSAAAINFGGPVPVGDDGGTWNIPTNDDCDECHRGRQDRILGFEQVGLGLPAAQGLTLAQLARVGS